MDSIFLVTFVKCVQTLTVERVPNMCVKHAILGFGICIVPNLAMKGVKKVSVL